MSRMNSPGPVVARASNNIYTVLAFISFGASLAAVIYVLLRYMNLGVI